MTNQANRGAMHAHLIDAGYRHTKVGNYHMYTHRDNARSQVLFHEKHGTHFKGKKFTDASALKSALSGTGNLKEDAASDTVALHKTLKTQGFRHSGNLVRNSVIVGSKFTHPRLGDIHVKDGHAHFRGEKHHDPATLKAHIQDKIHTMITRESDRKERDHYRNEEVMQEEFKIGENFSSKPMTRHARSLNTEGTAEVSYVRAWDPKTKSWKLRKQTRMTPEVMKKMHLNMLPRKKTVKEGFHTYFGKDGKPIKMYVPSKDEVEKENLRDNPAVKRTASRFGGRKRLSQESVVEPRQSFRNFINLTEAAGPHPADEDLKFHEALHQAG